MATTSSTSSTNSLPADFLAAVNPKTTTSSEMELTENRFLKLLTTQLKNQDPLNPMDNAQMTSQMAQISTVNGIEKLNTTLQKLMTSSSDAQSIQAAAMLGHSVLVAGSGMSIAENGQTVAGVEFPQAVDAATISIKDANGAVVRTINLGEQNAGLIDFAWDGKNDAGVQAAAGKYSFSVSAEQGGKAVTATTYQLAQVTGILRDKSGMQIELGQLGNFSLTDIRQIY